METCYHKKSKPKMMKKIAFGIILITAGVVLLAFNIGLLPHEYRHIFFSWQMLLIAIGLTNVFCKDSWLLGAILISIGGFFLLPHIFYFPFNFKIIFWPTLLIFIGIYVILKRAFFHRPFEPKTKISSSEQGYIDEVNIFGGSKQKIAHTEFKGGKISNIFGGAEIDLTQAILAPGVNTLEVVCIFGGVALIIPSDWQVKVDVTSIMGGFTDKRHVITPNSDGIQRELIIKGSAIFGGGDIKNAIQ